jgi:hypothetical protein
MAAGGFGVEVLEAWVFGVCCAVTWQHVTVEVEEEASSRLC